MYLHVLYDMVTCRYTSTPLHSVSGINIVPTPSFDCAELHNSDTLGDKLTQETATIEFSNQDIVESIETIKLEKF